MQQVIDVNIYGEMNRQLIRVASMELMHAKNQSAITEQIPNTESRLDETDC